MKCEIISHLETTQIDKLIDFIVTTEMVYNSKSPNKNAYSNLFNLFFKEESKFVIVKNQQEKIIACASLSTDEKYAYTAFLGHYHLPTTLNNRDVVRSFLFNFVDDYCKKLKLNSIVGPINFNTWLEYRFTYPEPKSKHFWEPQNPKQYPEDFLAIGFEIDKKYYSYFLPNTDGLDLMEPSFKTMQDKGFKISAINLENIEHQNWLYKLNLECFNENYLYKEISFEQYQNTILINLKDLDISYSFFIENKERKWGYIFNIPYEQTLIIKTIIVSPLARDKGLGSAMIFKAVRLAKSRGIEQITGALIREGNISQHFFKEKANPIQTNEYVLLKKVVK